MLKKKKTTASGELVLVKSVRMILSRLVDTFISRISLTMLPVPNPHNTACVLSWRKPAIGRADPPIIPVAEEVSPNKDL